MGKAPRQIYYFPLELFSEGMCYLQARTDTRWVSSWKLGLVKHVDKSMLSFPYEPN